MSGPHPNTERERAATTSVDLAAAPVAPRQRDAEALGDRRRAAVAEVRARLEAVRSFGVEQLTTLDLRALWRAGIEAGAMAALDAAGTPFVELVDRTPEHAAVSQRLCAEAEVAADNGDYVTAARRFLVALAWDPYAEAVRASLEETLSLAEAAEAARDPLAGAEGCVVLADAETLVASPQVLSAYAHAVAGAGAFTLAIDASRWAPEEASRRLEALVEAAGIGNRPDVHLVAFVGAMDKARRFRVLSHSAAVYGEPHPESIAAELSRRGAVPVFTEATLDDLLAHGCRHEDIER